MIPDTDGPLTERRSATPRRRSDSWISTTRLISFLSPFVFVGVLLSILLVHGPLSKGQSESLVPFLGVIGGLLLFSTNVVSWRNQTMHLHDQDRVLADQTEKLDHNGGTIQNIAVMVDGRMSSVLVENAEVRAEIRATREEIAALRAAMAGIHDTSVLTQIEYPPDTMTQLSETIASVHAQSAPDAVAPEGTNHDNSST